MELLETARLFSSGLHPLDAHPTVKGVKKTKIRDLLISSLVLPPETLPYQQLSLKQICSACASQSETCVLSLSLAPNVALSFPLPAVFLSSSNPTDGRGIISDLHHDWCEAS